MKFALVTGASTGIGRAVAVELGRKGYTIGLVARRKEKLEETKKMMEEAGGKAEVFACDLADVSQVSSLIRGVKNWTKQLDALINVAGIWHGKDEVYAGKNLQDLSGTFENGAKGWLPYFASKRALEDFTLGLAGELKDRGIRVSCVSPSDTATEEYGKYFPGEAKDANTPEQVAKLVTEICAGNETGKFWVIKKGAVFGEGYHK